MKYRKSSIKSQGEIYSILDTPEGEGKTEGFIREGAVDSQNRITRIYMIAFQFFYPIFCGFKMQLYESNE